MFRASPVPLRRRWKPTPQTNTAHTLNSTFFLPSCAKLGKVIEEKSSWLSPRSPFSLINRVHRFFIEGKGGHRDRSVAGYEKQKKMEWNLSGSLYMFFLPFFHIWRDGRAVFLSRLWVQFVFPLRKGKKKWYCCRWMAQDFFFFFRVLAVTLQHVRVCREWSYCVVMVGWLEFSCLVWCSEVFFFFFVCIW